MNDYLTAVDALVSSLLRTEFLVIASPALIIAGLFIYAEHRRDKRIKRTREELNAATLAYLTRCGKRRGVLVCDRAQGHAGPIHADSTKGHDRPVQWTEGGAA